MTKTGKTYFLEKLVRNKKIKKLLVYDINREKAYRHLPVIGPYSLDKFLKGKRRITNTNPKIVLNCIEMLYINGVLILDDFDRYGSFITQEMVSLLFGNRHLGLDILIVFHSLARVPPVLYESCHTVVLKKTSEKPSRAIYKMPNHEKVLKAYVELEKSNDPYASKIIQVR